MNFSKDVLIRIGLAVAVVLIMYLIFVKRRDCFANEAGSDEDAEEATSEYDDSDAEDDVVSSDDDEEDEDFEDDDEVEEDDEDDEEDSAEEEADDADTDEEADEDTADAPLENFSLMRGVAQPSTDATVFTPPGF